MSEKALENNEDLFVKSIGNFGIWQAIICLLVASMRLCVSWNTQSIIFLTPRTTFICKTFIQNSTFSEAIVSKCYDDCLEYQYENEIFDETIISQFDLICQRAWLASFAQSTMMFGLLVGTNLFGWIADRFGRRKALLISILGNSIFMSGASYAPNYWVFSVCRILTGICTGGIAVVTTVVLIEITGPKYRSIAGSMMFVLDYGGQMSLVIFAYFSNTWSQMVFATGIATAIFLTYFIVIPEVPRWLVVSGRTEEAKDVLVKAAKWNRRNTESIPNDVKQMYNELNSTGSDPKRKYTLTALFKSRKSSIKTMALFVIWWSLGGSGYGLNQYISFIGNNIYTTVFISAFAPMVTSAIAVLIIRRFNRKISLAGSLLSSGVLMIALTVAPKDHWASTALAITGLCSLAVGGIMVYIITPELYPTPIRNMGLGFAASGAKFGAVLAPFAASLEPRWLPSMIFAIVPFVAITACYILPETKDKPLEDTLED